jgi:protein ImuB
VDEAAAELGELREPDGLMLDVTGCERVFGGEEALIRRAREGLMRLGVRSRVAIAPTFGCAWAAARFVGGSGELIVPSGGARAALAPLPVGALRIPEQTVDELGVIGIERIGHLLELPRSTLPARFGDEILLRLDQALGQAIETIEPVRPQPPPRAERVFDGPTDRMEAIELTVRELIGEIASALGERESGARSLEVELTRSDMPPAVLSVTLGRASRDARHLWTLIRPKLEGAHLGFGVEGVCVRVAAVGRLRHEQGEQWGSDGVPDTEAERAASELLDALGNRLGPGRVLHVSANESHLPERAFEMCETSENRPKIQDAIAPTDRPTVFFDYPIPAEVIALTPDGPVHHVRWRDGYESTVACFGPERISGEWWVKSDEATKRRSDEGEGMSDGGRCGVGDMRDYFRVQSLSGRWLWVYRAHAVGRWFVHGVWG